MRPLRRALAMQTDAPALVVRDLRKSFPDPEGSPVLVVDVPSLALDRGESLAVEGESGSGKTTLLHLIAGILPADAGVIEVAGERMTGLSETARDRLRARHVGYLFQTFNLLPGLTALENVALGMAFRPAGDEKPRVAAARALARVGLGDRAAYRPAQLSVGQQQRVAIARALAGRPALLLADEPTANLDRPRAEQCLDLLTAFAAESGAAILVVTHDPHVLARFPRRHVLRAAAAGRAP
jgi:putative ABC transport system ATP-binding protein